MTNKLTTSLFAIAAIAAAGFGFNSLNNQTPSELANAAVTQNTEVAMVGGGERWFWDWGNNEAVESDTETQLAFDHRPCHEGRPGWDWGYGIFGTICVRRVEEGLNAFDAEEQIAFDPISRGETCWIRDYEPVPCPSDSWNAEELNAFDVEEQIAFDHTPCLRGNPKYRWGNGIFGKICVLQYNKEELNAFDAEAQIARGGVNMNVFNRCEKQHGIAYCLKHRYYNTEELNAFDAEEQIAEGAQCIWQGYTVDCDTLDADAQVIATANPYTQDAKPADTVDAVSQHLLAGADTDYELQLTK